MNGFISYIRSMFEEFLEFTPVTIAITVLLLIIGIGGIIFVRRSREVKFTTGMLVNASLCIALSFVLSYIKLWSMPQGGSVTPASMLPVMLFAFIYGPIPGVMAGIAYGILQYIQGGYVVHWVQLIMDYPLAFGLLGLAGLYRKNIVVACFIGVFGRFLMHFLTGVIFFSEITQAADILPSILYSAAYNGPFLGVEFLICAAITLLPQMNRMIKHLQKTYSA